MFRIEQTTKLALDRHPSDSARIDRRCRLAVVLLEQMGIDVQGNIRFGMPEPLGNRHDIHARVDKLQGMGVAQVVEAHIRPENRSTP